MTAKQKKTVEMLTGRLDDLEVLPDPDIPGELVFAGDGADGPEVGNIKPDGKVSWLVGG